VPKSEQIFNNRILSDRRGLRYPSNVTDQEWALIEQIIPPAKRGGNKRTIDIRRVVDGLMYVLTTGCQWTALPTDMPPRTTLNEYFRRWNYDGTLDRIHEALCGATQEQADRRNAADGAAITSRDIATSGGWTQSSVSQAAMPQARPASGNRASW
jgi:transposase